jgi:hypothetical protein
MPVGGAALAIGIHQHNRMLGIEQSTGEIDGNGGLAGAALEVTDRDKLAHRLLRNRRWRHGAPRSGA